MRHRHESSMVCSSTPLGLRSVHASRPLWPSKRQQQRQQQPIVHGAHSSIDRTSSNGVPYWPPAFGGKQRSH